MTGVPLAALLVSSATLLITVLSLTVALARWAGRITALVEAHDRRLADHEDLLREILSRPAISSSKTAQQPT